MVFPKRAFLFFVAALNLSMPLTGQQSYLEKARRSPNPDTAMRYLQEYTKLVKEKGDTAGMVEASCELARILTLRSLYTRAKREIATCLAYPFVKNNSLYEGKLYLELGAIHKYEGTYARSLTYFLQAHEIFGKIKAWADLVACKTQLAEYYRKLGKYDHANKYLADALREYEQHKLNDSALLIYMHNRAAAITNESNPNWRVSVGHSRKALGLAIKSGNKDAEAISLNELGFTYKNLRRNDSSEILYKKAEDIWFSMGADREALNAMNNRLMLYAHNDFPKEKITTMCYELISMAQARKIDYPLSDAYGFLYTQALRYKDSGAAYRHFYQYHQSKIQQIARQNDVQVTNITEQYENEKTRNEVRRITGKLTESRAEVAQKNTENKRIYFFISILALLLLIVGVLLYRITRDKRTLSYRNKEKDALIQEIHHRVKNNLQFISSLINMQMNSSVDEKEIHSLNDASRRIKAMALVHEMLYNHNETSGISIKQYLEELVLSLDQLVNSEKIPIEFKLDLADESFNVTDSIALGMITSELVSNSMKHAFAHIVKPEIHVTLKKDHNNVLFTVKDNGVGVKNETKRKKNLGLRLIDIFSRQLKGKYTITSTHGYHYEIQFKTR